MLRPVYSKEDCIAIGDLDATLLNCRVAPSDLEGYRRANEIRNPCCLCAYIDNVPFTESRVHMSMLGSSAILLGSEGRFVAECAQGRCGYYGQFEL
jgi:hypothetical protein